MEHRAGITTNGSASVRVAPDMAHVNVGVSVLEDDAQAARERAALAMSTVIAALRTHGIADADLRTGRVALVPEYDYADGGQRLRGHRATNDLEVTLHDVDATGAVIDAVTAAGGEAVILHGVTFGLEDSRAWHRQALESAFVDARARAEVLAKAAGVRLGRALSIAEAPTPPSHAPLPRLAMMAESAPTPIQAGEQDVTAAIVATWDID